MRILVFSDVHANYFALQAVLNAAGSFDAAWCLGDLVGYGPDPNKCIQMIRSLPNLTCLLGNHDAAVVKRIKLETFNNEAKNSVLWMQSILSTDNYNFLEGLPETTVVDDVTLVHGSPRNPIWEYILDTVVARTNLNYFESPFCFVGHTHLPVGYFYERNSMQVRWKLLSDKEKIQLTGRAILNPGSVGQPRDRDNRASYGIFNTEEKTWEIHRIAYDILKVQEQIYSTGLPSRNAIRLLEGW